LRGRNVEWAEQAVREAVNITADEAVTLKVVDLTAPDVTSLLATINGRSVTLHSGPATIETAGAAMRSVRMTWMEQFLQLVADPTVAYLLLSLGLLGLFIELSHPGVFLPGVVGGLSVLLALFSLGTLPVNWAGVLLIAFGFLLFGVDLFVPSFGSLTIGGVVSFVIGSYLLLGSDAPPGYEIARPVIWTMTACLVGFFVFLAGAVLRARLRPPYSGRQALIGEVGVVRERLNPSGMVFLQGELWQATLASPATTIASPSELPVGTAVVVNAIDGLRLVVRPATTGEATPPPVRTGDERTVVPVAGTTG
jgi:membrane-bound serine protease (ClpP class)